MSSEQLTFYMQIELETVTQGKVIPTFSTFTSGVVQVSSSEAVIFVLRCGYK